jgi:uncharacterized membrane protein
MNTTILEHGERLARDGAGGKFPGYWDPIFGMFPMPLVLNLVMTILVVLIFWWVIRGSHKTVETPLHQLKRRYIAGEIDRKTYLQMKEDIID